MRDFVCNLKVPMVVIGVVAIVWGTAQRAGDDRYVAPADAELFNRVVQVDQQQAKETGGYFTEDPHAGLELDR